MSQGNVRSIRKIPIKICIVSQKHLSTLRRGSGKLDNCFHNGREISTNLPRLSIHYNSWWASVTSAAFINAFIFRIPIGMVILSLRCPILARRLSWRECVVRCGFFSYERFLIVRDVCHRNENENGDRESVAVPLENYGIARVYVRWWNAMLLRALIPSMRSPH